MTSSGMTPSSKRRRAALLLHHLGGALHDALHAGRADEHVVRLLLEHELAGARQRVEGRLLEGAELVLPVAVGEVGEHEELQPVGRRLVEGAEDARRVEVAGVALEQLLGLLAALPAEVRVQQVDHRPEVAALLDVDLEQVAQVVDARRGVAEHALLLDARRLGVALDHDQPHQVGPVLAGHLLPGRLAPVLAEAHHPVGVTLGEEDPPAVVLHRHVVEVRPAVAADGDRRAQVDVLGRQRGARASSTSRGTSAASPRAPAGAAGRRRGSRCWGSARSSRSCSAVPSAPAPGRSVHPWSSQRSTLQRRKCQHSVVRWLSRRGTGSAAAPDPAPTASRRRRRTSPPARAAATGRGAAASRSRSSLRRGRRGRSRCCC